MGGIGAAGRVGALWYYTRLTEILTNRLAGTPGVKLAAELARAVDAIVALAEQYGHQPNDEIAKGRAHEAKVRGGISAKGLDSVGVPGSAQIALPRS